MPGHGALTVRECTQHSVVSLPLSLYLLYKKRAILAEKTPFSAGTDPKPHTSTSLPQLSQETTPHCHSDLYWFSWLKPYYANIFFYAVKTLPVWDVMSWSTRTPTITIKNLNWFEFDRFFKVITSGLILVLFKSCSITMHFWVCNKCWISSGVLNSS